MSKYLEFTLIDEKPIGLGQKIKTIGVYNKKSGNLLGLIEWFGGWRQYAFSPENRTIFNVEFLNDIINHIKELQ